MQTSNFFKAGVFAVFVVLALVVSWEIYLRQKVSVDFDDDEALWADKRGMVYEPSDKATVFIGSSRIKFDLDIPTWQNLTGDHAIQLANVGSSPRPVLEDLANDKNFKGKLIIDVTEGLFFNGSQSPNDSKTNKKIAFFKTRTPTERFSFLVNHVLESQFVFLDQDNFSLNGMLDRLQIPSRKGVFVMPIFPRDFGRTNFDRQSYVTQRFMADTNIQNQVKGVWMFFAKLAMGPPVSGDKLEAIFNSVKTNIDKIKARGGQVIFVRTPSSGPYFQGENMGFPRPAYWNRLLTSTHCEGIYFKDYPAIAHLTCPEWSHLSPDDAVTYTKNLVNILKEKGWSFAKN